VLPTEEVVAEEEEAMPATPEIIITSPSDGDLHFEANVEEDLNEIW